MASESGAGGTTIMASLLSAERLWRQTCSLPSFPKDCPKCGHKVKIYHINLEDEALFMCSKTEVRDLLV